MTGVTTIYVTGQSDVFVLVFVMFVFVLVFVLFVVSEGGGLGSPPFDGVACAPLPPPSAQDTGLAKRGFRARETACLPRPCRLLKTPTPRGARPTPRLKALDAPCAWGSDQTGGGRAGGLLMTSHLACPDAEEESGREFLSASVLS